MVIEVNSLSQTDKLTTEKQHFRKFSLTATLHPEINSSTSTLRRLSNVSDVVTRKLSSTIGWKTAQQFTQDIVSQGKCLCNLYIKRRLRRSGLFNRKLGLQNLKNILDTSSIRVIREVFPSVVALGDELERIHPRIYTGIARQACRSPVFSSPETIAILVANLARQLFQVKITWGKVISLFAIAAGLAVDCVRQGHSDYLIEILDAVSDVIEDELLLWLNENGGWVGLNSYVNAARSDVYPSERITHLLGCCVMLFIAIIIFRFLGNYLFSTINLLWNFEWQNYF